MIIKFDIITIIFKNEIIVNNNNNNNSLSTNNPLLFEKREISISELESNGIRLTDHKLNEIKWDIESTNMNEK